MKLYYSRTSPYARKVRVLLIETGLDKTVDLVEANPLEDPVALVEANPLGKVPALVVEDGFSLFDSPVICEYLDRLGAGRSLIPGAGHARNRVIAAQALADGLLDAAVSLVMERRRPTAEQSGYWKQRWSTAILRAVDKLEVPDSAVAPRDLGEIASAVALEYLDFRLPDLAWRNASPDAGAWLATASLWDSMQATAPPAA